MCYTKKITAIKYFSPGTRLMIIYTIQDVFHLAECTKPSSYIQESERRKSWSLQTFVSGF